jgi:hypothetical protein
MTDEDVPNHTLVVLRQIRDAVLETNARVDETNARLDVHIQQTAEGFANLGARVGDLEQACIRGFTVVRAELDVLNRGVSRIGQRIDHVLRIGGDASRTTGARIDALEVRVDRLEAPRTKRR